MNKIYKYNDFNSYASFINEAKKTKGTKFFQFSDRRGNFLIDLCNEYINVTPDSVDFKTFAKSVFEKNKDCMYIFISETDFANDEIVQKKEINRRNPDEILEY